MNDCYSDNPFQIANNKIAIAFWEKQGCDLAQVNIAHARLLVKNKLLSKDEYDLIIRTTNDACADLNKNGLPIGTEDVYTALMSKIEEKIGTQLFEKVYVGRSRLDFGCTYRRMSVRTSILNICESVAELLEAILERVPFGKDVIIPYYSFGQISQPGSASHFYLWIYDEFARDYARLQAAFKNTNQSPLGSVAGIGTQYDLDRAYAARLLGFDAVVENTADGIASSDYLLETVSVISILLINISRICNDFMFWAGNECRQIVYDSTLCGSSTAMPQKKNPPIGIVRAKASHALGILNDVFGMIQGSSVFPVSEQSREVFCYFYDFSENVVETVELMKELLMHSSFEKTIGHSAVCNCFAMATSFAEYLSLHSELSFAQAHKVVGAIIRNIEKKGKINLEDVTDKLVHNTAEEMFGCQVSISNETIKDILNPEHCIKCITTLGSPNPDSVMKMFEARRVRLSKCKEWLCAVKAQVSFMTVDADNGREAE